MNNAAAIWHSKTNDELMAAADSLYEFTEEGEQIIRGELALRGLPSPPDRLGVCRHCGRSIGPDLPGDVCFQCGQPLPAELLEQIAGASMADGDAPASRGGHAGGASRQAWEYTTARLEATGLLGGKFDLEDFEKGLNDLGKDGWELVSTFDTNYSQGGTRSVVAVFKRRT